MTPSQTQALPSFTEEEVKAAKAMRKSIIEEGVDFFKSVYMAGEICMWDEMKALLAAKQGEIEIDVVYSKDFNDWLKEFTNFSIQDLMVKYKAEKLSKPQ